MKFSIDESLGMIVYIAHLKMRYNLQKRIAKYDITSEQWAVLSKLYEHDGYNQKELAEQAVKDQASLTRMLDRLEKKGLVKREGCPNDRRAFEIYLTEKGRELRDEIVPIDIEALNEATEIFTDEELKQLKDLLTRLIQHLN